MPKPPAPPLRSAARDRALRQFERWADSYDRSWLNELVFFPTIRACQIEILRWQDQRTGRTYRLLDVGCGTGSLLMRLSGDAEAAMLVGLDYSPAMLRRLTSRAATSDRANVHAVQADSERLPFADASFDLVTCCNSFHHYPHQALVAREMHRVLAPGGMLILIDGFRDNVIGWVVFDVFVALAERSVHHCSWSQVRHLLLDAGFTDIRQRKLNVLVPLLVTCARR